MVSKQAGIAGRIVYSGLTGDIFKLQIGGKLEGTDREKCGTWEAEERGAFVSNGNLFFESVFYKGTSKIPLLFEFVLHLHQVQIKRELIPHVVHIAGTSMIESGIDGLYRGNNLGGLMRVLEHLQICSVGKRGY